MAQHGKSADAIFYADLTRETEIRLSKSDSLFYINEISKDYKIKDKSEWNEYPGLVMRYEDKSYHIYQDRIEFIDDDLIRFWPITK